jgi:hypothetical protein
MCGQGWVWHFSGRFRNRHFPEGLIPCSSNLEFGREFMQEDKREPRMTGRSGTWSRASG